ncbi:hypothetical protein SVIO_004740 [Streptomyces violaceusniger]|uniref:Uncharacterized protein n=1 Tax=Streptomyces violaceusniger TaxID=68280 RepID=A0A4D4KL25_STRVO|nr:hypothetical protein SVIO_004740 [Streptomyces violaceusniger]
MLGEQRFHARAQLCALGAINRLDERLTGRVVPVESADPYAGLAGGGLQGRRLSVGEGGAGHLEEAGPVALGIGPQAWFTVDSGHEAEVPPVVIRCGGSSA